MYCMSACLPVCVCVCLSVSLFYLHPAPRRVNKRTVSSRLSLLSCHRAFTSEVLGSMLEGILRGSTDVDVRLDENKRLWQCSKKRTMVLQNCAVMNIVFGMVCMATEQRQHVNQLNLLFCSTFFNMVQQSCLSNKATEMS